MLCNKCKQDKPPEAFHRRTKATTKGRQPWCKECRRAYDRAYHRKQWNSGVKKRQVKARIERNRQFLWKYLSDKTCTDCGESDPIVLQFDHLRDKEGNISEMVNAGYAITNILKEMWKCEIVCANCHARRTARQQGWYITTGT